MRMSYKRLPLVPSSNSVYKMLRDVVKWLDSFVGRSIGALWYKTVDASTFANFINKAINVKFLRRFCVLALSFLWAFFVVDVHTAIARCISWSYFVVHYVLSHVFTRGVFLPSSLTHWVLVTAVLKYVLSYRSFFASFHIVLHISFCHIRVFWAIPSSWFSRSFVFVVLVGIVQYVPHGDFLGHQRCAIHWNGICYTLFVDDYCTGQNWTILIGKLLVDMNPMQKLVSSHIAVEIVIVGHSM